MTHRLDRLTSLRALAAFYVFLFHLENHQLLQRRWPVTLGDSGVVFFFVLSGFVLAWSHSPGRLRRDFYLRRASKIYPMHLAMTAVAFLAPINEKAKSWTGAFLSATLLQAWVWSNDVYPYAGNSVSWTLSCEVLFYLCFPFLVVAMSRISHRAQWGVALSCFAFTGLTAFVITRAYSPVVAYHLPLIRLSEFVLGIAAALSMKAGRRIPIKPWMAVGLVIAGMLAARNLRPAVTISVMTLPYLAVVMAVAGSEMDRRSSGRTLRWLQWRPLVYCGEVSFAFYLVHLLVIDNTPGVANLHGWTAVVMLFAISAALAVALHHGVEKPAMRWLVTHFSRKAPVGLVPAQRSPSAGAHMDRELASEKR